MSHGPQDQSFRFLVSHLLDGALDCNQQQRLKDEIRGSDSARRDYVDMICLHVLLQGKYEGAIGDPVLPPHSAMLDGVDFEGGSIGLSAPLRRANSRATLKERMPGVPWQVAWISGLAIVIAAASFLAFMLWRNGPTKSQGLEQRQYVGVLTRTSGAHWLAAAPESIPARIIVGQKLQLVDGLAEATLEPGVALTIKGPAEIEFLSPMHIRANRGVVRVRVGADARGFTLETPTAAVVDFGTEFGVDVTEVGSTDVVVFDGEVGLEFGRQLLERASAQQASSVLPPGLRRLTTGQALHIDKLGQTRRVVSISNDRFPQAAHEEHAYNQRQPVIMKVTDNIRDPNASECYQIVRNGLREDARAYVDRLHEWNGVTSQGMPKFLLGADYVKTFNSDKYQRKLEISIELACPARLFLLVDDRLPLPDWISKDFKDTGLTIGVDEGWQKPNMRERTGVGAGVSVDRVFSIWQRDVSKPDIVKLGPLGVVEQGTSMYGIAAMPLTIATLESDIP